jgi:hypothetical protein
MLEAVVGAQRRAKLVDQARRPTSAHAEGVGGPRRHNRAVARAQVKAPPTDPQSDLAFDNVKALLLGWVNVRRNERSRALRDL